MRARGGAGAGAEGEGDGGVGELVGVRAVREMGRTKTVKKRK